MASISELQWHEGHQEARCIKTSYVLGIEHADDFFPRIWVEMNRRSHDLRKLRLVFIGDGAEWIWRRVADIADVDSVQILDFCHGVDHLAKLCKLLYGPGTEQFDKQLQQWRARLPYGFESSRTTLETFIRFNVDQKVIPQAVAPEDLFVPETLALV